MNGWPASWASSPRARLRIPYDILIVASLVEREAKTAEDRPKIARVIYNRVCRGIPLAIDASLCTASDTLDSIRRSRPDSAAQTSTPRTTRTCAPACRRRRSPTPDRASLDAATESGAVLNVIDLLCTCICPGDARASYLTTPWPTRTGTTTFAVTSTRHEANIAEASANGVVYGG